MSFSSLADVCVILTANFIIINKFLAFPSEGNILKVFAFPRAALFCKL